MNVKDLRDQLVPNIPSMSSWLVRSGAKSLSKVRQNFSEGETGMVIFKGFT